MKKVKNKTWKVKQSVLYYATVYFAGGNADDNKRWVDKKLWKKLKLQLDKLKKLWYIKKPSITPVIDSWLKIE